jgi:hypothetical protein
MIAGNLSLAKTDNCQEEQDRAMEQVGSLCINVMDLLSCT